MDKWPKIDDKDIEIAVLLGLGATQAEAGDQVELSNQAVSKRINHINPDFYKHFEALHTIGRKRYGAEKQATWEAEMEAKYFSLWEDAFKQVETAIKEGNHKLAQDVLKDIMNHKLGMPTRKVEVKGSLGGTVRHTHEITDGDLGEFKQMMASRRRLLAGEVEDAELL